MTLFSPTYLPLNVTLLVLPDSSIMSLACTLDPMRAANRIAQRPVFNWQIATLDGGPVEMTCGLPVAPQVQFGAVPRGDYAHENMLMIVAGFDAMRHATPATIAQLARLAPHYDAVSGVEAGSWVLARAGLLNGHKATTHWEDLEDFATRYPRVEVMPDRFVIDGKMVTTGGASPTFDLMLHIITQRRGLAFAMEVASVFIYDNDHRASDAQPLVSLGQLPQREPRVAQAIQIMEAHLDEPVSITQIATMLALSVRRLEGVFKTAMDQTPGSYYRRLRLRAARRMIIETRLSFREIAVRTGFSSLPAFSRAFKTQFGTTPSLVRRAN